MMNGISLGILHVCLTACFVFRSANSTSLMRRIRDKQSSDATHNKGLDLESEDWLKVPPPVQDVLISIDDKLRSLDTFSYTLKLARLDFSLDQLVRRMENIETKLGRLETKFDVRMEKVEEVVISKDIKEEFSNEHLSRRMENLNEKINTKTSYLDAKLDIKLERIMNKLELLDRDLHNSFDDMLERLIKNNERYVAIDNDMARKERVLEEISTNVSELRQFLKEDITETITSKADNLKSELQSVQTAIYVINSQREKTLNDLNMTMTNMTKMVGESNNKIDTLTSAYAHVDRLKSPRVLCDDTKGQSTQEQLNNITAMLEKGLQVGKAKLQELDSDVELYTRKVVNGMQELWKTSDQLKSDMSTTLVEGNKTREIVRQEFKRLHEQIEPLPKLEPKLSNISEDLEKKVAELSTTVDNSFATLLVAQNSFISSCRLIQEEELHVYDILQQIVYEMRNRSVEDIRKIHSELRMQSSVIQDSLASLLTSVMQSGNSTTIAMEKLENWFKQSDECVLRMENVNWNTIDSLCQQVAIETPSSREKLTQMIRDSIALHNLSESILKTLSNKPDSKPKRSEYDQTLGGNKMGTKLRNKDNTSTDYDLDYQLAHTDYSE